MSRAFEDIVVGDSDCTESDVTAVIEAFITFGSWRAEWRSVARYLEIEDRQIDRLSNEHLSEVPGHLLSLWKAEKGDDAKLVNLYEALEHCGLTNSAEALLSKFGKSGMADSAFPTKTDTTEVPRLGQTSPTSHRNTMVDELTIIAEFQPTQTIMEQYVAPVVPKYYIPRTLLSSATHASIDESQLVAEIVSLPSCYISIVAESGMGKTLFLGSIARQIKKISNDKAIVAFIALPNFLDQLFLVDSCSSALEGIAKYSSSDESTKSRIAEILMSNFYQVYLLLDGYDEINQEILILVDSFFAYLQENKNLKVIATTGPHLRTRLESIFNHLSYEIRPFNESDRIKYLVSYWVNKHGAMHCDELEGFAKKCLADFITGMLDKENYITGNPLYCMALGDVFAEEAKLFSNKKSYDNNRISSNIIFEACRRMIGIKFNRVKGQNDSRQNFVKYNVHEAINLLLPHLVGNFKPIRSSQSSKCIHNSTGLMKISPNEPTIPMYTHRCFAEFMLAEFIVDNLNKVPQFCKLLFKNILGRCGTLKFFDEDFRFYYFKPKYPALVSFIEMHLQHRIRQHREFINELPLAKYSSLEIFNPKDVCVAASTTCINNLEHTFDFVIKVLHHCNIGNELRDEYFKDLPHVVVRHATNVWILEKVLEFTKYEFGVDLKYHNITLEKDAIPALNHGNRNYSIEHFARMYKILTEVKFDKIMEQISRQKSRKVHVYRAISCLFPDWIEIFKPTLIGPKRINKTMIYSVGLIVDSWKPKTQKFIHRSFAEYILAEYIVSNLEKELKFVDLLFAEILGRKGVIEKQTIHGKTSFDLKYPVLVHFIEENLKEYLKHRNIDEFSPANNGLYLPAFNSEDVCVAILSCGGSHLDGLFRCANKFRRSFRFQEETLYGTTMLMNAIRLCGAVEDNMLRMLLDAGEEINAFDSNKDSVLFHAIQYSGSAAFIRKLVDYGADVHHKNKKQQNAVHKVMEWKGSTDEKLLMIDILVKINHDLLRESDIYGHTPLLYKDVTLTLLKHLVCNGADINAYARDRGTVLHWLGEASEYTELVSLALSKKFNLINQVDKNERTPIMHAIREFGSVEDEVLKLFHEAGADFNARDRNEDSVIFHAIMFSGSVDFIKKLVEYGADLNCQNAKMQNVVHIAVRSKIRNSNRLPLLDMLRGVNSDWISEKDDNDCTPVLESIELESIKHLVYHGADINAYSSRRGTVLHWWGDESNLKDLVRWALPNGFTIINHTDQHRRTPLMHDIKMVGNINDEVLKWFHEAGADFNVEDDNGDSVLFYVIKYSVNHELIRLLINYGADINHKNKLRQNAMHIIVNCMGSIEERLSGIDVLAQVKPSLLHEKDEHDRTPLLQKVADVHLLQRLRDHGADINSCTSSGETLMHIISDDKDIYTDTVRWALLNGFKLVNQKDQLGQTPLMRAVEMFGTVDDEVLDLFYKAEANFNARDSNGDSILFYALQKSRSVNFIRALLKYEINVNHANFKKQNALHKAVEGSLTSDQVLDAIEALESKGFNQFNGFDERGFTPLDYTKKRLYLDEDLFKILKSKMLAATNISND